MVEDRNSQKLSRRQFFQRSLKAATEASDQRSMEISKLWFRPPFAAPELRFLDLCTRCHDCLRVCPTGVIIPLDERYGRRAAGTPALDLVSNACLLCEDWPCVQACEPKALSIPDEADEDDIPLGPMATALIDESSCLPFLGPECGACRDVCPVEGAFRFLGIRPFVDWKHCVGCGLCRQACVTDPKSIRIASYEVTASADE